MSKVTMRPRPPTNVKSKDATPTPPTPTPTLSGNRCSQPKSETVGCTNDVSSFLSVKPDAIPDAIPDSRFAVLARGRHAATLPHTAREFFNGL